LSPSAREALTQRTWPGNVRELHNALERALILAGEGEVSASHLTALHLEGQKVSRAPEALLSEGFNLDVFERQLLEAALVRAGGNKSAAARMLGITRRRLYSRLESLDARLQSEDE
jgi:DNA-binding NtrC family response regulator